MATETDRDPDLSDSFGEVFESAAEMLRGGSHRHMASHLVGPLQPGAMDAPLEITETGRTTVPTDRLRPLLIAAPRAAVPGGARLRLRATRDPDGAAPEALPPRDWAAFTEAGTFLPLDLPPAGETGRTAAEAVYALAVETEDADGVTTAVPDADIAATLAVHVVEGNLGRLLFTLAAEKGRIRRAGREILAARRLAEARGPSLDRHGEDLGVERFRERLRWDAARDELVTEALAGGEPDDSYRRRLELYRPLHARSRSALLSRLRTVDARFTVVEEDNPFAMALHLVQTGDGPHRTQFLDYLRAAYLVFPASAAAANNRHRARPLSTAQQADVAALRKSLRDRWTLPAPSTGLAPVLASTLDRAGRALAALGVPTASLVILRGQDDAGGSRFELGLGAEVAALSNADAETARTTLLARSWPADTDTETARLLSLLAESDPPVPTIGADPALDWLWKAFGLRTVHPTAAGLYLSHLPTFGLAITGPSQAAPGANIVLEARYNALGDPGVNAVLAASLTAARAAWADAGETAWTEPDAAGAEALRTASAARGAPTDSERAGLAGAGLPAAPDPARLVGQLQNPLLADRLAVLALPAELSGPLLSDADPAARETAAGALRRLLAVLRAEGFSAAVPLITGDGQLALVVGVASLPLVGTNLSDRRTTGFRWYAAPVPSASGESLSAPPGTVGGVGSRTTFTAGAAGLSLVAVLGYARRPDLTDPYEYRVELPADAHIDLAQYEFVMNLLGSGSPIGVEINTFSLRRDHVDLDGDGDAEPLSPSVARTFRAFRRSRSRGEIEDFTE